MTTGPKNDNPDVSRRTMLMRLGLAAGAIYAAPVMLQLSNARASGGSGGSGGNGNGGGNGSGASGASGGAGANNRGGSGPSGFSGSSRSSRSRASKPSGRVRSARRSPRGSFSN